MEDIENVINKKKNNKLIIPIVIAILIVLIIIGYFVFRKKEEIKEYELMLLGDFEITLNQGDEYFEPGYVASYGEMDVTNAVKITGSVDSMNLGIYQITYQIGDKTLIRVINVVENQVKREIVFKLLGLNRIELMLGEEYKEEGFMAHDEKGISLEDAVLVEGNVDTNKAGTYIITYKLNYFDEEYELKREIKIKEPMNLTVSYDNKNYKKESNITIKVVGSEYKYLQLPDNLKTENKEITYKVTKNGTYNFIAYDNKNNQIEKSITVSNIDNNIDSASCKLNVKVKTSNIEITANDTKSGIESYKYNGKTYTTNKIDINSRLKTATITVYDKVGNKKDINCTVNIIEKVYGFILIGDSRFVATETNLGDNLRKNDTFVAKGAMGWDWFNKTAIGKVNAILKANPDRKYYIMCNLGINDSKYHYDDANYGKKLSELANSTWKEHIVGYISTNPYADVKDTRNQKVEVFNQRQKNDLNGVYYCDTYNGIGLSNFKPRKSSDTTHYNKDTNIKIYNYIINNCAF